MLPLGHLLLAAARLGAFYMDRRNLILGLISCSSFGVWRADAWPLVTRQQSQQRECRSSSSHCFGPNSIWRANNNHSGARHNETSKNTGRYPCKVSSGGRCKNCREQPACSIWVSGNRHHQTNTRTCKANSVWHVRRRRRASKRAA